ncbi:MAG: hypothetical protein HYZ53_08015 [Planctomycetes bacterium]|nr:hypothetical protein [Planctomycetota bacterium]
MTPSAPPPSPPLLPPAPSPLRALRLLSYLNAMFPPAVLVPAAIGNFLAVHFALQALAAPAVALTLTWRMALGALSSVLFMLLMRVYDELKDADTDLELARAGDPRYTDRPVVTGKVTLADLRALRWGVTAVLFAANAALAHPVPIAAFAVSFLMTWLSFKWFFCPAISRNLLLAFVTHNPLSIVLGAYVVAVYAADFGAAGLSWEQVALLLVGMWAPVAAWETSRKVRVPEDETVYPTYSKLLGWRVAALVPAGFLILSVATLVPVASAAGLGRGFEAGLAAAAGLGVAACVLFRLAPTRRRANLRPYVELYAVVATVGLAAALAIERGVSLR